MFQSLRLSRCIAPRLSWIPTSSTPADPLASACAHPVAEWRALFAPEWAFLSCECVGGLEAATPCRASCGRCGAVVMADVILTVSVTGVYRLVVAHQVVDSATGERGRWRTVFSRDPGGPWWARREEVSKDGQWRIVGVERVAAPRVTLDVAVDGDMESRGPHTFVGP